MIHFLKFKVQIFKYTYIFDLYTRNSRKNPKFTIFHTNLKCIKNVHYMFLIFIRFSSRKKGFLQNTFDIKFLEFIERNSLIIAFIKYSFWYIQIILRRIRGGNAKFSIVWHVNFLHSQFYIYCVITRIANSFLPFFLCVTFCNDTSTI